MEVSYETFDFDQDIRINKVVNAGKYRIVAHFTDTSPNYVKIPDMEAILTINKAQYDLTGVSLANAVKEFDGEEFVPKLTGENYLPTGITPVFHFVDLHGQEVFSNANVGDYIMVARFEGGDTVNYEDIPPLAAALKVTPRIIHLDGKISFESKTVNFDENVTHHLELTGTLPDTVEVEYENNDQTYAGEYEVLAHIRAKNPNEAVDVPEMVAYLTINRVRRNVFVYNNVSQQYDLEFSGNNIKVANNAISVVGIDETVFNVVSADLYSLNDNEKLTENFAVKAGVTLENGTTYKFVVKFEYVDDALNSSVILSEASDIFTYIGA